jgi:FAD/FMN-containing dehydrogenase
LVLDLAHETHTPHAVRSSEAPAPQSLQGSLTETPAAAPGSVAGLPFSPRSIDLQSAALWRLRERLAGQVIVPGAEAYATARRVWNRDYDRFPGLIVHAADAADVMRTVEFARDRELPLAIRSGGHSMAGHGTVDSGVVLDLSAMKGLQIDPARRVSWTQSGVTWGEYATKAGEHGLATPAGDSGSVGVGGLTLGGGIGFLARKHALAIDSLRAVELVTADGRLITASSQSHPDLFWALRGGGGNFGVVTGFEFDLHSVPLVLGGAVFYELTPDVLQSYAAVAADAPDELTTIAFIMQTPPLPFIPAEKHGTLSLGILVCYAGDTPDAVTGMDAHVAIAPLRALGPKIGEMLAPMPYSALFDFTAEGSLSRPHTMRSGYFGGLDSNTAWNIVDAAQRMTSPFGMIQLRVLGGAMASVPHDATAFAHRRQPLLMVVGNAWEETATPEEVTRHRAWTLESWARLRSASTGAYVNFLEDEGAARVRDAYPTTTLQRLAAVKRRYDPTNLFRINQNIRPAS